MLTNLEKLNRLAAQKYEDGQEGLLMFSHDFCSIRSELECMNTLKRNADMIKHTIDVLYGITAINKEEYQKWIAILNGIEVVWYGRN